MGKIVFVFNGRPKCGKDTLATFLIDNLNSHTELTTNRHKFAQLLIDQACCLSNISLNEWNTRYATEKDVPWNRLLGMSQREWICYIAEEVVKPKLGRDFYARALAENIDKLSEQVHIITDGGFPEEIYELCECETVDHVVLVRVEMPSVEYIKDTRKDLSTVEHVKLSHVNLTNIFGGLSDTVMQMMERVYSLLDLFRSKTDRSIDKDNNL